MEFAGAEKAESKKYKLHHHHQYSCQMLFKNCRYRENRSPFSGLIQLTGITLGKRRATRKLEKRRQPKAEKGTNWTIKQLLRL